MSAVALALWLAQPSRSYRTFKTQRLRVEVSDLEGEDLSAHEVVEALEEALEKAKSTVLPAGTTAQTVLPRR